MVFANRLRVALSIVSMTAFCAASVANAAVLLEDAALVAKSALYEQSVSPPQYFTVVDGGRYRVTLNEVISPTPSGLTSLELIITKGTQTIARLPAVGSADFDVTPGKYTVRVLGAGPGFGSFSAVVTNSVGANVLGFQDVIVGNPIANAANRSPIEIPFAVTSAGTYELRASDRNFPAALENLDMVVFRSSGAIAARVCQPAIPGVCSTAPVSFVADAGSYKLIVNAVAASPLQAGLFSVKIAGGPANSVLYSATHPVGVLEPHANFNLPSTGSYSLTLSDLQFPVALAAESAVLVQDSELLTTVTSATTQSFNGAQGPATLYTMATPATAQGVGTLGVRMSDGAQIFFSDTKAFVGSTASSTRAYAFAGTFPTAGQYRIQATDFSFPTTIPALQLLAIQDGAPLGAASSGGSTVQANAGQFFIVAITNMLSPTATGLFGVSVSAQPSGTDVLNVAQGVGDLFNTRLLTVSAASKLDVTLSDLSFPTRFQNLALLVTRGNTLVGQIFGGGTFSFSPTPGDYSLNFVATNNLTDRFGLYGIKVEDSPPEPTVSFSASASSVPAQGSITVTWSTTDATSCTASGDDSWSGTRATSGTNVSVGPFGSNKTLTLTCTGAGGTKSSEVKITLAATSQGEAGGGSVAWWQLFAIALLASWQATKQVARKYRRR